MAKPYIRKNQKTENNAKGNTQQQRQKISFSPIGLVLVLLDSATVERYGSVKDLFCFAQKGRVA